MTSDARGRDAPFRVLVENESALGPVFRVDPERFAAALDRHPAWRGRLRVTFSEDGDQFESAIGTANLLIGWQFPREHLASRAPCLRWIHLTGAGVNHLLPLDWLPAGTVLTNNRGVHAPKCQEFVTMALLLLANRIPTIVKREALPRHGTRLIAGQRATVVGVGSMGGAAARAARQLGLHVTGVRRSGQPHPDVDVMYATDALHTALTGADHVVICAPLTRATWHLIDACAIAAMKPGATLVNIGRGGVVDEQALASALISGHISCALLDVFEQEPLPPQASAWTLPNTVITPHCSSDDAVDYVPRTLDLIFANLDKMVTGQELLGRVDPVLEY